jgi:hypothetical protein
MDRSGDIPVPQKQHLADSRPVAKGVRAQGSPGISAVRDLIRARRRIALAYRRTQSDIDRHRLADIDRELAEYNIDIPAIEHLVAQRKR